MSYYDVFMKKNVLIPTDFSENSWNAIVYALSFFEKVHCNFYLLHVSSYEAASSGISVKSIRSSSEEGSFFSVEEEFERLQKRIAQLQLNAKHHFFTIREYVFLVDSIRKQVEEKKIDYIVMGTKGATGLKEKTVGSNTGDVITKVKCPILVIPEKATYTKVKEIAFPTDYNIYYKSKIRSTLTEIMMLTKGALRVLHVSKRAEKGLTDLQTKNKDFLEDAFLDENLSFHFLSNPDLEAAVQCFVESRNINMITMVAKNLNFFQRILFHPTVEKISYHTTVPFLVLHE